jgi:hypothetical protein
MISEVDPVKGSSNANLACGQSAQPGTLTVPANPGSNIQMFWVSGDEGNVCPFFWLTFVALTTSTVS